MVATALRPSIVITATPPVPVVPKYSDQRRRAITDTLFLDVARERTSMRLPGRSNPQIVATDPEIDAIVAAFNPNQRGGVTLDPQTITAVSEAAHEFVERAITLQGDAQPRAFQVTAPHCTYHTRREMAQQLAGNLGYQVARR